MYGNACIILNKQVETFRKTHKTIDMGWLRRWNSEGGMEQMMKFFFIHFCIHRFKAYIKI